MLAVGKVVVFYTLARIKKNNEHITIKTQAADIFL